MKRWSVAAPPPSTRRRDSIGHRFIFEGLNLEATLHYDGRPMRWTRTDFATTLAEIARYAPRTARPAALKARPPATAGSPAGVDGLFITFANGARAVGGRIRMTREDGVRVVWSVGTGAVGFYVRCARCVRWWPRERMEAHLGGHCRAPGCGLHFDDGRRTRHEVAHLYRLALLPGVRPDRLDHLGELVVRGRPDLFLAELGKDLERASRTVSVASRSSACPRCGGRIDPGSLIERVLGSRWIHLLCPSPAAGLGPLPIEHDLDLVTGPTVPGLPAGGACTEARGRPGSARSEAELDHSQDQVGAAAAVDAGSR